MRCAFCGSETDERFKKDNITVIAHFWCIENRMTEMDTDNWIDCLLYEDEIKQYSGRTWSGTS